MDYRLQEENLREKLKFMTHFDRWQYKYKRYKSQIPDEMRRLVILHYSLPKIIWDWFILCLVLYTAIEVPLVASFILTNDFPQSQPEDESALFMSMRTKYPQAYTLLYIDLAIDVLFFIDIVLNFRTTYVEEGETLVTCPWKLAAHYLKTYFTVDLVAAIPWELFVESNNDERSTLFSLLKTVRLLRLFRAARKLDRNYEYSTSLLFLMLIFFMLVSHWLACIWYAIGDLEKLKHSPSWLNQLAEQMELPFNATIRDSGPSLRSRYLTSLYFVLTCVTTVGFGNIAANTDWEKVFTICAMIVGSIMYAGIFGNVSAIIYGQYSSNFRYRREVAQINEFIRYHRIHNPLARLLREYSRHTWSQTKGTNMLKVIQKFPDSLKAEISFHIHLNVLSESPLFRDADPSILRSISLRMKRHHYLPGHYVVYQGDEVRAIYFLKRGVVDVVRNRELKGQLGYGDVFGSPLTSVDARERSYVSLRASTCCDIHVVGLDDLNYVLEAYPEYKRDLFENIEENFCSKNLRNGATCKDVKERDEKDTLLISDIHHRLPGERNNPSIKTEKMKNGFLGRTCTYAKKQLATVKKDSIDEDEIELKEIRQNKPRSWCVDTRHNSQVKEEVLCRRCGHFFNIASERDSQIQHEHPTDFKESTQFNDLDGACDICDIGDDDTINGVTSHYERESSLSDNLRQESLDSPYKDSVLETPCQCQQNYDLIQKRLHRLEGKIESLCKLVERQVSTDSI